MNIDKFPYEMGKAIMMNKHIVIVFDMFETDRSYNFYTNEYYPKQN